MNMPSGTTGLCRTLTLQARHFTGKCGLFGAARRRGARMRDSQQQFVEILDIDALL
ncbi:MAG: hypothetical protein AB7O69_17775 [Burkholderiales bacterium]